MKVIIVVTHPSCLDDKALKQLQKTIAADIKAGRPVVLTNGARLDVLKA